MPESVPVCLFCGGPLPISKKPRKFCRTRCRRKFQDARRKAERREEKERRKRAKAMRMADPWSGGGMDEMFFANACLDPLPVGYVPR